MPDTQPRNVPELFLERVGLTPDAEAFRHPAGAGWRSLTWADTEARVRAISAGLRALGVQSEQVCAILASTRIEWVLSDFGILCAGAATSTIYPSSTAEECAYILADSGAVVAFAEDGLQVAKLASRRAEMPALRHVVVFDGEGSADGWVTPLADLEARGRAWDAEHPGAFEETAASVRPDALATLLYTSGTTGVPKGVELTHSCWVSQSASVQASGILDHEDPVQFFWLPLAHSFGKMIGTAQLRIGFPTAVDGRVDRIVENLGVVRPTFVCAVPRIFEKVHNKILSNARDGGPVKAAIFRWAIDVGLVASRARRAGRPPGTLLQAQLAVADRLVFHKVRELFGGRLRFFVSGSAPLSRDIAEFFDAMGIVILEGYGLTESSAATHANLPSKRKIGTVGPAFRGIEVRIAEDGEILMRGPWIMRGYRGMPEQTAEALDPEGWLHTGDVGFVDADGFLSITDRKKDLIKTSGGKYVAPAELESKLKAISPFVSQVLVHGDRRNFVTALVTLDADAIAKWAAEHGHAGQPVSALARLPEVQELLQRHVDRLNAGLPRFATVKKFAILPRELSEAEGEVTPSQKLKRKVIEQHFRAEIDAMYGGEPPRA
ncbi:AMP-dependent synthetase and ligase [Anaeromyxobacter dehalogenans 2CP-1]|uniref:AMP-dependent synthetase and ligase n=1 Tax=Anaeromyxobacter dehalogenans (strain ATCC BAA-258 / DSM 21875 / 2CP-1) TaxID=455488 RepID=B8JEK6_ANAD2|nr:long-chain fatty acid--CoA ligase [Anaeromyxobacter dehalogenans]ACL64332.1 AMP-dependent synthetase and ligase [Anaeromyxobacter dehalogenans 2CP-1]